MERDGDKTPIITQHGLERRETHNLMFNEIDGTLSVWWLIESFRT